MDKFFKPRSIAVIGASRDPKKVGHVILKNIIDAGFKGKIFPINPNADSIINLKCYSSVLKVRDKIDLAIISIPVKIALEAVKECGEKGIKNIIMVTAGFSEVGNVKEEQHLALLLRKYNVRLIGPNVLGILDSHSKLDTLFLPSLRLTRPKEGGISFICQSGAVGSATLDLVSREGFGFAKFISYGNALDVNETDLLEYLGNDNKTKVICLYIEGIKNGKRFMEVAKKVTKKKPVIAIKGGVTEAGSKAALSHTASLAGSYEIYKGAFKQAGIIWADSLSDLFNYAKILEKTVTPKGPRVLVITNGGGYGILCADAIQQNNLKMASFSDSSIKSLKKQLPPLVSLRNPVDLVGDADNKRYEVVLEATLNDSNIDVILVVILYQTPLITSDIVELVSELNRLRKKPIIVVSTGGDFTELHKRDLETFGVPCYTFPDQAIRSIKVLCDYYRKN